MKNERSLKGEKKVEGEKVGGRGEIYRWALS